MSWKEDTLNNKDEIDCVDFKFSLFKNYYCLRIIGKDGYISSRYDIHKTELQSALDFLKKFGFKMHEHSIIKY